MKYQILFNTVVCGQPCVCVCDVKDSKGRYWGFTATEEQAKDRVQALAEAGIVATYEPIDGNHWVNNWIG